VTGSLVGASDALAAWEVADLPADAGLGRSSGALPLGIPAARIPVRAGHLANDVGVGCGHDAAVGHELFNGQSSVRGRCDAVCR
jgi:hypothetical protein